MSFSFFSLCIQTIILFKWSFSLYSKISCYLLFLIPQFTAEVKCHEFINLQNRTRRYSKISFALRKVS
ncbi:hypothetical protein SORBI_3003G278666 [Sorghum bicolor]|uniref:Uncharacterized protein n=1 Tax=Sorghum bicolor TaxID=4558 RepID=A0A1W0VZ94_SORBI|nr:hypothetical protein SORBI_3003G278666 [Sorghum bicolor]